MTGDWTSGLRRAGAWIALVGMLVALVLPLVPRASLAAAAGLDATVICTPYGIKVVALDQDGKATPDQSGGVHCPLCVGPGGGWAMPAPLPLPFRLPLVSTRLLAVLAPADLPPPLDIGGAPNAPRPPPVL